MPTYTYRCGQCEHKFDIVQRMSEDTLTDCPACQAAALVKEIQSVGFALKGTGWYVTDFRDKGKTPKTDGDAPKAEGEKTEVAKADASASDSKTEVKTEAKSESKSESKSETKTEPKTETKPEAKPATTSTAE